MSSILTLTLRLTGDPGGATPLSPPASVPHDTDGIIEFLVGTVSPDGGSTLINMGIDIGTGVSFPPGSAGVVVFSFTGGPQVLASGTFNFLRADLNFALGYTTTARFDLTLNIVEGIQQPVPEPATMLLLSTGLLGVGAAVRKRRKANKSEDE